MTVTRARQLRKRMSPTEIRLWRAPRLRPEGLKFRKQHPLGPYVLDFFCGAAAVAIEVDGSSHDFEQTVQSDQRRDRWMRENGVETLRIPFEEVRRNLEGVVAHIIGRCVEKIPPPHSVRSPSPQNRGEDE